MQERVQLPGQLEEGQSEFAVLDVEQPKHKWEHLTFIRNNRANNHQCSNVEKERLILL